MSDWKEFLKDWGISDDLGLRYKLAKAIEDKVCTLLEEERKKWEREWKEKVKKALNSKTYPDKVKSQCADELEGLIWFKYADGTQCLRSGFVIEQIDNLIKNGGIMQTIRIMKIKMEEVLGTDGMKEIGDKLNRVIRLINKTSFCIDPFEEREK